MYGLEKKPKAPFEFDLEKDLKADPNKTRQLLKAVDERIHEIKGLLREGTATENFDNFGVLLHGYAALQKVLNKVANKK
jgi:hypothetical protein